MDDRAPDRDPNSGTDGASHLERDRAPGIPRWVKLLGVTGVIAAALVVIVMLLAGGQHGPGRHIPGADTATGTPLAGGTEGATAASTAQESASTVGGPADKDDAARTVPVTTLDRMAYEPSGIEVTAGETVTFVVTNVGQAVHEFTLGDAAMQQEHAAQMEHMPDGMAHDQPNSLTLQPRETKQLTWRFGAAGTVEYACHEPGHYAAGMRGRITVS